MQQIYNLADTLIVGRYIGPDALAGIGITVYSMMKLPLRSRSTRSLICRHRNLGTPIRCSFHKTMVRKRKTVFAGGRISLWHHRLSSV